MNKKFLSALLCGAAVLASTSTFVSCKDYDDDINSLQDKLTNEISAREALAAKVAAAESAISDLQAAKAAIEAELAKKENSADHAADVQALQEKIAKNEGDIATLKSQLQALQDKHTADIADLKSQIAVINSAIDELKAAVVLCATKAELADAVEKLQANLNDVEGKLTTKIAEALNASKEYTDAEAAKLAAQIVDAIKTSKEYTDGEITKLGASLEAKIADALKQAKAYTDAEAEARAAAVAQCLVDAKAYTDAEVVKLNAAIQQALTDAKAYTDAEAAKLNIKIDESLAEAKAYTDAAKALLEGKIADVQSDLNTTKGKLEQVSADLTSLTAKFNTLSDKLYGAAGDVARLDGAVQAQAAALESAKAQLQAAIEAGDAASVAAAEAKIAELDALLSGEIEDLKTNVAELSLYVYETLGETITQVLNASTNYTDESIADLRVEVAAADQALKDDINALDARIKDIVEVKIPEVQTAINAVDSKLEQMSSILSNSLRSLVFMPELYVDGIEAIQYRALKAKTMVLSAKQSFKLPKEIHGVEADENVEDINDYYYGVGSKDITVSPVWPVQYHLNPSTSNTKFADIVGFNVREVTAVTRANSANLGVTAADKYLGGADLFKNEGGVVTVGIKIAHPELLAANGPSAITEGETGNISAGKDNIVALQAKREKVAANDQEAIVTSDYALLQSTDVKIEGIVWTKDLPNKKCTANDEKIFNLAGYGAAGEEYACGKNIHVYDTPQEALMDCEHAVMLKWDDKVGINLEDYLGIHYTMQNVTKTGWSETKTWKFGENTKSPYENLANYGITYEFETVDYAIGANLSKDSRYLTLADAAQKAVKQGCVYDKGSKKGTIIAGNVDNKGEFIADQSETSVGREPLVRVLVKYGDNVLLDGYILVKIVRVLPTPDVPNPKDTEVCFGKDWTFDLCNGSKTLEIMNWSQFSKDILTDLLDNMAKEDFDGFYGPADPLFSGSAEGDFANATKVAGTNAYLIDLDLYAEKKIGGKRALGHALYYHDAGNPMNERIMWSFTAAELEEISHDSKNGEYTAYIVWKDRTGKAPYAHIWGKLTVKVTREQVAVYSFVEKTNNYWYGKDGSDEGYEAVVFNATSPLDGGHTRNWLSQIRNSFINNEVYLTQNGTLLVSGASNVSTENRGGLAAATVIGQTTKGSVVDEANFYFTPTTSTITALNGKKYTITPYNGSNADWNKLIPTYITSNPSDAVKHDWVSEANANDIVNKCVIAFDQGVFANKKLYAEYQGVYTQIAELDQNNGQISLLRNDVTYDVINAIGYVEGHKNIMDELHAEIGVIARDIKYTCNVAARMENSTFIGSWQRPININDPEEQVVLDAHTNANKIYLADILHIYDWRGYEVANGVDEAHTIRGCMEKESTKWLWAYYGIKSITVDCTPSKVWTNMHGLNTTMDKVNREYAKLYANENTAAVWTYNFNLTPWNSHNMSSDLYNKFLYDEAFRESLGYIYYDNNQDNVTDFDVIVPISVTYDWGTFTQKVRIHILRSLGN